MSIIKKSVMLIVTLILLLSIIQCTKAEAKELTWYEFDEGMAKGKSQKKPVIVDFYADWCQWCHVMDEKTFSDATIKKILNEEYILVRIDTEAEQTITFNGKKYSTREFQGFMGVRGLPTLAFFDKSGQPITILPGYVTAEQFKPILGYISSECYTKKISYDNYVDADEKCEK
jgi:thioredoxin-related protein